MDRITLGAKGISASRLCLGALGFGSLIDRDASFAVLDRFAEAGGTFLDSSNNYAFWLEGADGGESERTVGEWMADRGVRDRMVVGTKVGYLPRTPGDRTIDDPEPLSAERIAESVGESLERLRTDRIDVLWSHRDDRETPLEETVRGFGAVMAEGRVGVVGAANHESWRVERARSLAANAGVEGYSLLQKRYSYLQPRPGAALESAAHRHASPADLDFTAHTEGMALLAYSSLLAGAYTSPDKGIEGAYDHPGTAARLAVLDEVAREADATRNQVVLAWLLGQEATIVPLVGASSVAQLDETIAALDLELTPEQLRRMNEAA
ncbi:aldo/keto reductase [Salininema proteolyticum]|uniref:Aldo/keto reductase n=1 Tax=Salininema proteolyticum TaxID=1607685 RepID=A0ABV8U357_9ACTN